MTNAIRFYHFVSVKPETIVNHEILNKEINIIGTSRSDNGKLFVAIAEHKSQPFYGVQFHPESNQFLRGTTMENANKSPKVIKFLADIIFGFKKLGSDGNVAKKLPTKFEKFQVYKYNTYKNSANSFGTSIIYQPRYTKDIVRRRLSIAN